MNLNTGAWCQVWFLFDAEQLSERRLRTEIALLLRSKRIHLRPHIDAVSDRALLVEFNGGLRLVESCRDAVTEMAASGLFCLLVKDGASEKVREQLYPVLATMEQELRHFISMALIDVSGLRTAWSCMLGTVLDLTPYEKRRKLAVSSSQPLEFLDFRGLLKLIDSDVPGPTGNECRQLLTTSATIEEATRRLDERLRLRSFWDSVFSRYFADRNEWRHTEELLHKVADARNLVMHFRVSRSVDMDEVIRLSDEVINLLRSRRPELAKAKKRSYERSIRNLTRRVKKLTAEADRLLAETRQEASGALPESLSNT